MFTPAPQLTLYSYTSARCCIFGRWATTAVEFFVRNKDNLVPKVLRFFALFNMRNFSFARKRIDLTRLYKKCQGKLRNVLGHPVLFQKNVVLQENNAQTAGCKLQIDFKDTFHKILRAK